MVSKDIKNPECGESASVYREFLLLLRHDHTSFFTVSNSPDYFAISQTTMHHYNYCIVLRNREQFNYYYIMYSYYTNL